MNNNRSFVVDARLLLIGDDAKSLRKVQSPKKNLNPAIVAFRYVH